MLRCLGDVLRLPRHLIARSSALDCETSRSLSIIVGHQTPTAFSYSRSQGKKDGSLRQEGTAENSSSTSDQSTRHREQFTHVQERDLKENGHVHAKQLHRHTLFRTQRGEFCEHGHDFTARLICNTTTSAESYPRPAEQTTASNNGRSSRMSASSSATAHSTHLHQSARPISTMETAQQSAAPAAEPVQQAFVPPGRIQNAPAAPWTPTRELRKRNFLPRRMGHLMQVLDKEARDKADQEKKFPNFESGDLLELTLVVPENKGREAKVRGICMAKRRRGFRTSFTLLNHVPGGGTVERSFPLYSPTLQSITVLGSRKVRRAKLYYLRGRKPSEYKV